MSTTTSEEKDDKGEEEEEEKKKNVVVLDINGVLLDRKKRDDASEEEIKRASSVVNNRVVFNRPFVSDFVDFLHERFVVVVWSTATKYNTELLIDHIWGERKTQILLAWSQEQCTSVGSTCRHGDKPVFLKELGKLKAHFKKENKEICDRRIFLLDDSPYKTLLNENFTSIHPRSFSGETDDDELAPSSYLRKYLTRIADDSRDAVDFIKEFTFDIEFSALKDVEAMKEFKFVKELESVKRLLLNRKISSVPQSTFDMDNVKDALPKLKLVTARKKEIKDEEKEIANSTKKAEHALTKQQVVIY